MPAGTVAGLTGGLVDAAGARLVRQVAARAVATGATDQGDAGHASSNIDCTLKEDRRAPPETFPGGLTLGKRFMPTKARRVPAEAHPTPLGARRARLSEESWIRGRRATGQAEGRRTRDR